MEQTYRIFGSYNNNTSYLQELIDEVQGTYEEASELLFDYQLAYGAKWQLSLVDKDDNEV